MTKTPLKLSLLQGLFQKKEARDDLLVSGLKCQALFSVMTCPQLRNGLNGRDIRNSRKPLIQ